MTNFAELQNDIVKRIIVVSDTINDGQAWCVQSYGGIWVDGTNAYIGWTHSNGVFIAPASDDLIEP